MAEMGFEGFEAASPSQGILGPKGMPLAIAERFAAAVNKVLARSDVREKLAASGNAIDRNSNPKSYAELVKSDLQTWAEVAKSANIREK
jgi:tripartite-type tricarboxylate transporter receptor subunit TctC